jgi:hypothetical protein
MRMYPLRARPASAQRALQIICRMKPYAAMISRQSCQCCKIRALHVMVTQLKIARKHHAQWGTTRLLMDHVARTDWRSVLGWAARVHQASTMVHKDVQRVLRAKSKMRTRQVALRAKEIELRDPEFVRHAHLARLQTLKKRLVKPVCLAQPRRKMSWLARIVHKTSTLASVLNALSAYPPIS